MTYITGETRPSARFVLRARRLGHALGAASRGLMSARVTAAAMREHFLAGEVDWVWRMLLQGRDHLVVIIGERNQVLLDVWEAEPGSVGSAGWDALLAAVTHEREIARLKVPPCATPEALTEPWMPAHPFLTPGRVRAQTPDWLRRQNIYVPACDLVTA